jgi:hypothetical protein
VELRAAKWTGGFVFKLKLVCEGVPNHLGSEAAVDITEEFTHRPWHQNVICSWDGSSLILEAENDFDLDGLALQDEFSDAICACITPGFDGSIKVLSVTHLQGQDDSEVYPGSDTI